MRRTDFVASTIALWQAICATVVAAFGVILALVRGSGLPIGVNDASSAQTWGEVWLGLLNRIGVADMALAVFLIAASLDAIRSSSKLIRIAARAFNPHALGAALQRLIALTATSAALRKRMTVGRRGGPLSAIARSTMMEEKIIRFLVAEQKAALP